MGVDWASQAHQACLIDAGGKIIGEEVFAHGGAGLAELCTWLLEMTGAAPSAIAVAIEVPHGPIVETLLERGFEVYAINPKQLERFRDRFTVAGAKDDRRDAQRYAGWPGRHRRECRRGYRLAKIGLIIGGESYPPHKRTNARDPRFSGHRDCVRDA